MKRSRGFISRSDFGDGSRFLGPTWSKAAEAGHSWNLPAEVAPQALSLHCGSTQTMMIHDSAPHRVFKISELTRLIASQLILISRKSAVSLACASRHLEEPVLSTLWESQRSLHTLLEVLPVESWGYLRVGLDKNSKHVGRTFHRRNQTLKLRVTLVQDQGRSVARGLEQGPALRVLDAPSRCERRVDP